MSRPRKKVTASRRNHLLPAGIFFGAVFVVGIGAASYAYAIVPTTRVAAVGAAPELAPKAVKSQYEITANDNGKTYTYPVGVQFSVFLDEENYPKNELVCAPGGAIAPASVMPVATLPLYAVRFNTLQPGECRLHDKDFSMTVVVEGAVQ